MAIFVMHGVGPDDSLWWATNWDGSLFLFHYESEARDFAEANTEDCRPNADGELPTASVEDWRAKTGRVRWGKLQTLGKVVEGPETYHSRDETCHEGSCSEDIEPECLVCLADGDYTSLVGDIKLVDVHDGS